MKSVLKKKLGNLAEEKEMPNFIKKSFSRSAADQASFTDFVMSWHKNGQTFKITV